MSTTRQLAAIMFTDIVGYTALMGNDELKAFAILNKNRALQKPIIEQFNGRWIKEIGDGILASFSTVSDAVNAAIKIQEACNAAKDFQLRIGIHLGETLDIVFKFLGLKLTKEEAQEFRPGNAVFCRVREKGAPVMRSSVSFKPPDFEIVETVTKKAQLIKDKEFPDADALVMFSCIGRHDELWPMVSTEIDGVKNSFNVPMAGLFTYGEFGRATDGKNEYHNNTCCWVALKEK